MTEIQKVHPVSKHPLVVDIVLEKSIFNNIFEKDIRRVFIYKKAERLAKAIHLIAPAFTEAASLRERIHGISVGLIDAALLAPSSSRVALSRELLALSSLLSIARSNSLLSAMNAELIIRETHHLLQELASYEEPRLALEETPSLSMLAKNMSVQEPVREVQRGAALAPANKGHKKDIRPEGNQVKDRREAILSIIRTKHRASIKDISTLVRGVSEKTIQRELISLIAEGAVLRQGERRWSTYQLAG